MCLVILALIIGAIVLAKQGKLGPPPWVRNGGHPHGPCGSGASGDSGSPIDKAAAILAERLANGDITPEEYRERLSVLRESAPPSQNPGDLR